MRRPYNEIKESLLNGWEVVKRHPFWGPALGLVSLIIFSTFWFSLIFLVIRVSEDRLAIWPAMGCALAVFLLWAFFCFAKLRVELKLYDGLPHPFRSLRDISILQFLAYLLCQVIGTWVPYHFAPAVVADQGLGVRRALEISRKMNRSGWYLDSGDVMFATVFTPQSWAGGLMLLAGFLCLGVGLVIAFAVVDFFHIDIYKKKLKEAGHGHVIHR
jgi:hypothetical protein